MELIKNKNMVLTELPKKGKFVDRKRMEGMSLEILYYGEIYMVTILKYFMNEKGKYRFLVDYDGYVLEEGIDCNHFLNGKFGGILNKVTSKFKVEIGESFIDDKRNIVVIDREYRNRVRPLDKKGREYIENTKWYKCECKDCGYDNTWIEESHLLRRKGTGCSVCNSNLGAIVQGINDILTTNPEMVYEYGLEINEAKKNSFGTHKKLKFICKDCGCEKFVRPVNVDKNKSISCFCGDGFSYPEKLMYSVLKQLNIEFIKEFNSKWTNGKRYDFYIPSLNCIIETHGGQHYEESNKKSNWNRTLQEEQENDRIKRELALENGIEYYIELDCRKSDLEYIKINILKSELNQLFDLQKVNWTEADLYAIKSNKVKTVCEYWNSKEEWETISDLERIFNISKNTVVKYLTKGAKLKWCRYTPLGVGKSNRKKVEMFKDGVSLGTCESVTDLAKQSKELLGIELNKSGIFYACKIEKEYNGFTFKYI